jgi:protocatechuate 3,4-dioxygenase alpha subunit
MSADLPFPTASQTVGPYYSIGLTWEGSNVLANERTRGERITIRGRVLDGNQHGVEDALLETWQANSDGHYASAEDMRQPATRDGFTGFGRIIPDADGRFELVTILPGPVPGLGGTLQAPHIVVSVFARGLLQRLVTRIYFPQEPGANAADRVLASVAPARRATLVAQPDATARGIYHWNVILQGEHETVFFEC